MDRKLPEILMVLIALMCAGKAGAANTEFSTSVTAGSTRLVKVGEGSMRWMLIKVYEGALYLDEENPGAHPLNNVAKRLELEYAVGIDAEKFRESGNTILRRNVEETTWIALQDKLRQLNAAYRTVEKGDRYALTYLPGKGTTLSLNGDALVTIEGDEFARAYFSIWLGDDPAKRPFREALLGN